MNKFNLFGDIVDNDGQKWFESDVTPAMFIGWLNKQDGKDVEINLNSNGGSVSAGLAIANAIKAYPGNVRANVLGLAASMASVIACAADELSLGKGAFLMIHNPWSSTVGTADNLRHEADVLDAMKDSLIGFYLTKFDRTKEELDYCRELGIPHPALQTVSGQMISASNDVATDKQEKTTNE